MLADYFSIHLTEEEEEEEEQQQQQQQPKKILLLKGLPLLIAEYQPNYAYLPIFLYRLATQIDFSDELRCLEGVARELAKFYSFMPPAEQPTECEEWQGMIQYVLYPNVKKLIVLSDELWANGSIRTIASTDRLYRVFERC